MTYDIGKILGCFYDRFQNGIVKDEGNYLDEVKGKSIGKCGEICDGMTNCWSFGFAATGQGTPPTSKCWFHDKILKGNEQTKPWGIIYTVYKKCRELIVILVRQISNRLSNIEYVKTKYYFI